MKGALWLALYFLTRLIGFFFDTFVQAATALGFDQSLPQ
jgi:hypothetical protein